jgi:hypothetical protein
LSNWTAYPKPHKPEKRPSKVPDTDLKARLYEIRWKHGLPAISQSGLSNCHERVVNWLRRPPESTPGAPRHHSSHLHTDGPQNNHAIRPNFGPDGASIPDKKICLIELIILGLTAYWLLSFFGQSTVPRIPHTGGFIDMLSIVIVVLIIIRFLS